MNWNNLEQKISNAVKDAYLDIVKNLSQEKIYAFAIYTDADCYTVLPTANTQKKHEEKISREAVTTPSEKAGYKWYIGEWAYEVWRGELFDDICDELSSAAEVACLTDTHSAFKKSAHQCLLNSLLKLRNEGLFSNAESDFVVFISSSDYDEAISLENWSAKILNSQSIYEKFERRYKTS